VRKIFLAREKSQKRPALLRDLIPNRPAQHGIAGFQRVQHRALRDRTLNFKLHFAANMRQRSQMLWKYDSDHIQPQLELRTARHTPELKYMNGFPFGCDGQSIGEEILP
jgi:hypothetical protein